MVSVDGSAVHRRQAGNPLKNAKTNKKVVLLTNQGAHIIALVKPVDMLQQLLMACHGPHHEAVKGYFQNQTEAQACATSALLACMPDFKGTDIAMWATQAFLLYGSDQPTYGTAQATSQGRNFNMSTTFMGEFVRGPNIFLLKNCVLWFAHSRSTWAANVYVYTVWRLSTGRIRSTKSNASNTVST